MDKSQETAYIRKWGFKNRAVYENFVKTSIQDLDIVANNIFDKFARKVAEWVNDYLEDKKERFVAKLEQTSEDRLTKGHERVVEKILESWEKHSEWKGLSNKEKKNKKEPQKHDPIDFIETITDLIRFRIVCNYLSDIYYIQAKIEDLCEKDGTINKETVDDHIETPFPDRKVGHRALQYVFKYADGSETVLFEVQVMTQLQHAWDKKDHHLIYEYVRIGRGHEIPLNFKNRMAAMSELLYVADTAFESLNKKISNIMEKKEE